MSSTPKWTKLKSSRERQRVCPTRVKHIHILEAGLTNACHIYSGRFRMQKYASTADDVLSLHSENTTVPISGKHVGPGRVD